jgi:hypothetical protein
MCKRVLTAYDYAIVTFPSTTRNNLLDASVTFLIRMIQESRLFKIHNKLVDTRGRIRHLATVNRTERGATLQSALHLYRHTHW